jgi:3',5'-cyclic AMP phosphodiesterase CpdA
MNPEKTFTLAHLSDPHLADHQHIRFVDLFNKRFFGYMKWRLKRSAEHHLNVLGDLFDDIKVHKPDHIVITGDLTHLGLPAEYAQVKDLLNSLGPPSQITVIPGNHDAYVASALNGCVTHWRDYIVSDQTEFSHDDLISVDALFPSLRVRGPLALIGVCTARPCNTLLAVGSIGKNQLQQLRKLLIKTGQQGLFRVVLIHHPPISGVVSWRKRLTDAKAFRTIVKQHGVELILHGHAHRYSHQQLRAQQGLAPVIGISSATAAVQDSQRRARYHLFQLSRANDKLEVRVTVRSYLDQEDRFGTEEEFVLPECI